MTMNAREEYELIRNSDIRKRTDAELHELHGRLVDAGSHDGIFFCECIIQKELFQRWYLEVFEANDRPQVKGKCDHPQFPDSTIMGPWLACMPCPWPECESGTEVQEWHVDSAIGMLAYSREASVISYPIVGETQYRWKRLQ